MFQDALQSRAHNGDQAAFRDIYNRYSRDVYAISHTALGSPDSARAVVKQVFLHLYRELMRSESDLDIAARLSALTNEEIRITRIAAGDLDPEALLVQYTVSSQSAVDTAHTMDRVRAHMQQTETAPTPAMEPESETDEANRCEPTAAESVTEQTEAELFAETSIKEPTVPMEESAPIPEASEAAEPAADLPETKKKSRGSAVIAGILLFVLIVVFAWLLVGILMDLAILPFYDLGYSLFNKYVFDFFRLP